MFFWELLIARQTLIILLSRKTFTQKTDYLAYTLVDSNYFETLAKTFLIPAGQKHFVQENVFNMSTVRPIVFAMNKNGEITRGHIEITL